MVEHSQPAHTVRIPLPGTDRPQTGRTKVTPENHAPRMTLHHPLPDTIHPGFPVTALAPMQDVTTLPFMQIIGGYGPPDYFFTEYFRVYPTSRLEPHILASITENTTGRPVFAQLIGEDLTHLKRTVQCLLQYPVAGIDLNLGCPAPKVYRKCVGGGLLREPSKIDAILGHLRDLIPGCFTVKMRVGFDRTDGFPELLRLVRHHRVDLLSVHGRTVREGYHGTPHYDLIALAARSVPCPVLANGNISSVAKGREVLAQTQARGLMIGRAAIRNPWIFRQLREHWSGLEPFQPTLGAVRDYVEDLWLKTARPGTPDNRQVAYMKKFLNFVGQGVDPAGDFLREIRRTTSAQEFFAVCDQHLASPERVGEPFPAEPWQGLVARPNRESAPPQPQETRAGGARESLASVDSSPEPL